MTYGDFIHLTWRTASDEILRDEAFNIVKNPKYDGYQKGLPSMFYNFFDKKTSTTRSNRFAGIGTKNENIWNKELVKNYTNQL